MLLVTFKYSRTKLQDQKTKNRKVGTNQLSSYYIDFRLFFYLEKTVKYSVGNLFRSFHLRLWAVQDKHYIHNSVSA